MSDEVTGKDIPRDHKLLALRLLSDEQLQKALTNPAVAEERKAEVREEIARRQLRKPLP